MNAHEWAFYIFCIILIPSRTRTWLQTSSRSGNLSRGNDWKLPKDGDWMDEGRIFPAGHREVRGDVGRSSGNLQVWRRPFGHGQVQGNSRFPPKWRWETRSIVRLLLRVLPERPVCVENWITHVITYHFRWIRRLHTLQFIIKTTFIPCNGFTSNANPWTTKNWINWT